METQKYTRKPFYVDAVQVTSTNITHVADWCGGIVHWPLEIGEDKIRTEAFIKVRVHRPLNEKQTQAFVSDWILSLDTKGFKVYTDSAFRSNFDPVFQETQQDASFRDVPSASTLLN